MTGSTKKNKSSEIRSLKKRADFLRLRHPQKNGGYYRSTGAFLLQAAPAAETASASPESSASLRYGLVVTKKMGNAVTRNRIKRRLRACIKSLLPLYGKPGYDYVLVARQAALKLPFAVMLDDLKQALVWPDSPTATKK
ncbi:MAG: ribonuclease P protein component [Aquisalinus sp.]|nr:ribonuclease P protein component [Aquisalinus sp.]